MHERVTEADIVGTWAGLRPLLTARADARTADLSRRHTVRVSPSGVVTVTGGKLTTYRRMAADAVDAAVRARRPRASPVAAPSDSDCSAATASTRTVAALEPSTHDHLVGRYGTEAAAVLDLVARRPDARRAARARAPVPQGGGRFAVRHEMARTLADVLDRRTRARLLDRDAAATAAADVAELIAPDLGWSAARDRGGSRARTAGVGREPNATDRRDAPSGRARRRVVTIALSVTPDAGRGEEAGRAPHHHDDHLAAAAGVRARPRRGRTAATASSAPPSPCPSTGAAPTGEHGARSR